MRAQFSFVCFAYFFFVLFAVNSFSQSRKIDSLKKNLLTAKEDTNKVNTLNALAWELSSSNPDTSILLSNQALALAGKTKWEIGIGKSEHNLGVFSYFKGDYAISLEHYFKALAIWEKLEKEIPKNNQSSIINNKSNTLGNIGTVYKDQADYPKALDFYFKALKMDEELVDKNGIAADLGNIGLVYWQQADYPKALDCYFKALKIAEELGNKNRIAIQLGNIGIVYMEQADYPKALDYYFKALKMDEGLKNKNGIARHLVNIGNVYYKEASAASDPNASASLSARALDYYFKALKMDEELGSKNSIAAVLGNIGSVYKEQADYPKALDYYFKALKIDEELGTKNGIAITLGNIGSLHTKAGKFAEAEKYLKHSLALSDSLGDLEGVKETNQSLSQLYDTTGRTKLAFEHYKKYIAARDSIANDENTKKQTRIAMQYEFDKKQTADSVRNEEILKQENLKHEQQIKQQKIYTYGGAIGFALMLVVAGVSFRAYRNKQKANEIISHQKKLVEEKQKEILDSIYYARRIQRSLLTSEKYIARSLDKLRKG